MRALFRPCTTGTDEKGPALVRAGLLDDTANTGLLVAGTEWDRHRCRRLLLFGSLLLRTSTRSINSVQIVVDGIDRRGGGEWGCVGSLLLCAAIVAFVFWLLFAVETTGTGCILHVETDIIRLGLLLLFSFVGCCCCSVESGKVGRGSVGLGTGETCWW